MEKTGTESVELTHKQVVSMYEVSGLPINEKSLRRYKEDDVTWGDSLKQLDVLEEIRQAPANERAPLILQAFKTQNLAACHIAADMIQFVPADERAPLILQAFKTQDPETCHIAADMIQFVPADERAPLISQAFETQDPETCHIAAEMIQFVPNTEQRNLFHTMKELDVLKYVIQNKLYSAVPEDDRDRFGRTVFPKTGSQTTLVTGELKDKVIVRHIRKSSFRAWKKAYESHQAWKSIGYVPIEPIVSYRVNKGGLVDVFSGVLDINLQQYMNMGGEFAPDLLEQTREIERILQNTLGIEHGHPHEANYALRFFRKENGDIDYDQMPRIYLIDFDQAHDNI